MEAALALGAQQIGSWLVEVRACASQLPLLTLTARLQEPLEAGDGRAGA